MTKLTVADLKKIKEQTARRTAVRDGDANVKITVHMGTCGIAAGAREVMSALLEELAAADRPDIRVLASGCTGKCDSEPNVTVQIKGSEPVVYGQMDPEKIRRVFERHALSGEIVSELVARR